MKRSELGVFVLTRPDVSLQLLGIILSCVFWNLLVDMSESADMVDFKLKKAEVDYTEGRRLPARPRRRAGTGPH